MLGTQKNLLPRRSPNSGVRAAYNGLLHQACNICLGERMGLKQEDDWIFESFPVSFKRILWEAREFGRAAVAWIYFLTGKQREYDQQIS